MTLMQSEIYEQPQAVAQAIERNVMPVTALVEALREREIRHVAIAARGTSDHAATYAKYLLEIARGVPVSLAALPFIRSMTRQSIWRAALSSGFRSRGRRQMWCKRFPMRGRAGL